MKNILLATAMATCIAGTAFAGALEFVPEVEAEMIAPTVTDWSGPYAGVLYAMGTGDVSWVYGEGESSDYEVEGNMYGVFGGYNFQRGSLVFGPEVAYSMGSVGYPDMDGEVDYGIEFTNFLDLKARAGFAAGNALLYGFAGWTSGTLVDHGRIDETFHPAGMNYGAGIDLLITENIFIGAEYIVRDLSEAIDPFTTIEANVQAVEIRLGMNF